MHTLLKGSGLELRARVSARLFQLGDDIAYRRDTKGLVRKVCSQQRAEYAGIANKFRNSQPSLFRNASNNGIGLGVHGRGI